MTQNYITILTIIELLFSFIIIYLIIRADIIVNIMQQEVNILHLHLPAIMREIRQDLKNMNIELLKHADSKLISSQKLGYITGKIFTEILMLRLTALQINKKFLILTIISKIINMRKIRL